MQATEAAILLAVGLSAGILGGMLGIGGSVLMIPAMAFLFHDRPWDDQHLYQASAMVVNVVVAAPAMLRHRKAGAVPVRFVRVFLPVTMVFIILGVVLSNMIESEPLRRLFGLFLIYVIVEQVRRLWKRAPDHTPEEARITRERSAVVGAVTGTVSGLLGIGGGIVSVPLAQGLLRLPLRQAIAASASTMVFSAVLGSVLKMATLGVHGASWRLALLLSVVLAPTALVGGHIGAGLTHRVPVGALRATLAVVLLVMAGRMLGVY